MARHGELGILRQFRKLGYQNLLYLQAELTHLENDLENLARRDAGHKLREEHSKNWYSLAQGYDQIEYEFGNEAADKVRTNKGECYIGKERSNNEGDDGANDDIESNSKNKGKLVDEEFEGEEIDEDREQWDKALQIREKLREYCKTLGTERSDNTEISQEISAPRTTDMASKDVEKGSSQELSPNSEDSNEYDGSQIFLYEDTRIVRAVNVLSIVFASMLPITSILVLYFVSNTINRLVIAVVFEGLFAFALAMTTRASRGEIFAATSAFAAVQVVFMTGSDGYIGL
ncbi:hypothetical protein EYC80_009419 [Monilinia laxa]|uniref:DUF6594 domain-containing protein n=1 Tax=Monilinia laxa TaxID=61186 RepID=A0A5N6JXY8_MONLA|nr:hypothetical protein EYC80_009419 [Monilinia laxa]